MGLKFKADFYSKMSVCSHKLGVEPQPPAIPTLQKIFKHLSFKENMA